MEPQTLLDVSGAVPESVTSSVLEACRNRGFAGIQDAITDAIASGWGVSMDLLLSAPDILPSGSASQAGCAKAGVIANAHTQGICTGTLERTFRDGNVGH